MDPPPNQQDAGVNLTRALEALSPYINNPRRTVVRIEAFVLAAVALMVVQFLLGSARRWCGHWSVQGALWVAYTASIPLITYTIGQMASSPVKNGLYTLWSVFLFWAAGSTNSIIAYDLEDNKSWKRHLFVQTQYYVYLGIIWSLLFYPTRNNPLHPFKTSSVTLHETMAQPISIAICLLFAVLFQSNFVRLIAGWMVTKSASSKFVADYMKNQAAAAKGSQSESLIPDPETMKGYKYLVWWPRRKECSLRRNMSRFFSSGTITIDKIWKMKIDDSLLKSNKGVLGVKDLCLSFALSHLLKRRYFEMECAEANCLETRRFVLEGLLSQNEACNNYTRTFQIIEVELGFLYDFFFTKYATFVRMEGAPYYMAVLKLIFISLCGVFLLRDIPTVKTLDVIEVGTRRVDVIITIIMMGSFFLVEALQLILYVTSDWATVSLVCSCIRGSNSKCKLSLIRFLQRIKVIKLPRYWQNKMGQSSVITRSRPFFLPFRHLAQDSNLLNGVFFESLDYIFGLFHSMIFSRKTFIEVPDSVKKKIVSCLKEYKDYKVDDSLTNGQSTLNHHCILEELSWTLENKSQTSIMLIWHIATEYCSISLPSEGEKEGRANMFGLWKNEKESLGDQQVATILSRYCAYLMSFVPDLLPGNSTDTLFILEQVLWKADAEKLLLYKRNAREVELQKTSQDSNRSSNEGSPTMIHDSRGNDDDIISVPDSDDDYSTDETISVDHDYSADNNTEGDDIFTQGLDLGRQLEEIEDEGVRWMVMAEFWAETIVYIAPSDNAKAHMERLAKGGEFLTHIWALLTHAGILQRGKKETETPEDNPDTLV